MTKDFEQKDNSEAEAQSPQAEGELIKGEQEEAEKFSPVSFCREAVSLLLMAYLFIIFCMYPFYMQNGYMEIGNVKYNFYKDITIGAFALIIPLALICTVFRAKEKLHKMSFTDWAVLAYGTSVMLSFLFSEYKREGLWGEKGWYMGLITQLLFVVSYFLISRFWEYEGKILLAFMAAASVVFLLGILNRFSVFPIEIEGANSSFLSTMGNINWYCGYWAVLFPIGFILYWCTDRFPLRLAGLFFTVIGIAAGVSQGSSSAFIVFAGLYFLVFCLSFQSLERMKRFFELVFLFGVVCQGLRLWRIRQPYAFNYYNGTLCDWITMTRATLGIVVAAAAVYVILCAAEGKKIDIRQFKILRQAVLLIVTITVGVYILLLMLNSRVEGGIRFMGNLPFLRFNEQWGSARGATWSAGIETYRNMPMARKLVGAGPDCFAMYMYTIPELAKKVAKQFSGSRLTNAHNEWLTVLVNNGIFGFLSYAGLFGGTVIRFIYYAEKAMAGRKKYLYLFGFSAFAYSIHNIVSFQQILSTPFVFLLLGMGERLVREETGVAER